MCRKARQLGITGWVRNCRDGTVEAMIQGAPEAVNAMIEWARTGTDLAQVEGVDISTGSGEYADFEKRDTA
jgi:acylphosphatase